MKNKILGGIMGLVVGDALGVPVEFKARKALTKNPVTAMIGYGTHAQPMGTWSDDSTMTLCLLESLCSGLDYDDICNKFLQWVENGYMTAHGKLFDIGGTTLSAIRKYSNGTPALECGESGWDNNGNGSLMRILPLAFYTFGMKPSERYEIVRNVSKLTHAHEISIIACNSYIQLCCELLKGYPKEKAYEFMVRNSDVLCEKEYQQTFERVFSGRLSLLQETDISSSGYVVHTLEAALWCFLTTENYEACVLKAVNLGDDTDTTAAVAGGLAGIYYGVEDIPADWRDCIPRKEDIETLCQTFTETCKPFASLYAYIPYFESKPTYDWICADKKDGVITMSYPQYDETLESFAQLVSELELMDLAYPTTMERYKGLAPVELSDMVPNAGIELVLCILTICIRSERFCTGAWASNVRNGLFLSLLQRLRELEGET